MFIGHFALGFAAKRLAPRTSLGTFFVASEFADILFPLFLLLGWERFAVAGGPAPFLSIAFDQYPISHGLAALVGWGALCGLLYALRTRYARGAVMVGLLVVSHWVLDFVTHRPDMPLWPGGPRVGLELWASVPGTIVVEGALFAAGVALYAGATRARDGVGRYGLWALVALLVVLYVASLLPGAPPTPGQFAVIGMLLTVVMLGLGAWVDRHREPAAQVPGVR
ncbi:MAG TPA: hypothetical protein VEH62_09740 [Gemmatimonadales bacterium]|nr:hypothetical protein [Gemmatimonadales bacterium]